MILSLQMCRADGHCNFYGKNSSFFALTLRASTSTLMGKKLEVAENISLLVVHAPYPMY